MSKKPPQKAANKKPAKTQRPKTPSAELQSTAEQLRSLQSRDEELIRRNEQLQSRNSELAQLSNDLTNVLSGVDIPVVILGLDRRIRRFTPPAEKLLGLGAVDIGGPVGTLRIALPDLDNLVSTVIQDAREAVREVQAESGRWFLLRMRPFRAAGGKIEGVLMVFVDVHEIKQQEEALKRDKTFISAILHAAKDLLVMVLDREGRIVYFNRASQRLTGYSLEEVKGRQLWDFLLIPEEEAAVRTAFHEVLGGAQKQLENYWVAKDGRRLRVKCSHTVAKSERGSAESVIKTGIDITERHEARRRAQESEATVQAIMQSAAGAILASDKEGRIQFANDMAAKIYGYGPGELIGRPVESLVPTRLRKDHLLRRAAWFAEPHNMSLDVDVAGLRKDGTEFPIEINLSYISASEGNLCVAFISDITERKKSEQTLLQYKEHLQRLTAALLFAQESGNREVARELHDVFSQELAAIGMEISSLKEEAQSGADLISHLSDLGKKIARLAAEIHQTSRELHPAILEELGLEPALRQECQSFEQRSGIPTEFTAEAVPTGLPDDVALCLYRVAQESLRNVHKHAADAEIVRVSLVGSLEGITLRIEDTGDGFELEEALKKGGLGFISMEERVRLVNGTLTIRSQPGKGTTVTAVVPLKLEKKPA
jgi:PAS domain S-box-containing protein